MTGSASVRALSRLLLEIHRASSERDLCALIAARGEELVGCAVRLRLEPSERHALDRASGDAAAKLSLQLEIADETRATASVAMAISEHVGTAIMNLRRSADDAMRADQFEALIERIPAVTYVEHAIDPGLIYVSPQIESIFGVSRATWLAPGDAWADRIHEDDRDEIVRRYNEFIARGGTFHAEYRIIDGDQATRWVRDEASRTTDGSGNPEWIQGVLVDITGRKALEAELNHLAYHDALTDLPNRLLFRRHVELAIARAALTNSSIAVVSIDLDGFKAINDTLGHQAGDEFLRETAKRLRAAVRPGDIVSREGGDEFAVLLADLPRNPDAIIRTLSVKLARQIARPYAIGGHHAAVSASLGAALYPGDGSTVGHILDHADRAMYRVKRSRQAQTA